MSLGIQKMTVTSIFLLATLAASAGQESKTSEAVDLLALQAILTGEASELPDTTRSSSCGAKLVSLALHYRQEPDKYRNDLFAALVIDDYVDRAAGKYNYVNPDEIATTVDSAMATPNGITDNRIKAAVGFCVLRDKNLWVVTRKDGRISLARVVRDMALSSLLEGTDEDALAIVNAIDAHTAASHSSPGQ
jgi:hypothetical protein